VRFRFTAEQEEFRREVKAFLDIELEAGTFTITTSESVGPYSIEFSRKMAQRGWIGMTWPRQYGGEERTYVEHMILNEEIAKVHAPIRYHFLGDRQVGPALIKFGSDWQKDFYLPRIVKAEENSCFCLLFSEPNAGSDLVAISTSAEKDGDYYIINGQKTWSSTAHLAHWGWLLAKTEFDSSIPRHLTCSEFIVDMKSPGITVRPIVNMVGEHCFNEVFFDDVRIHKKYLVGQENAGFKQIMEQIDNERAGIERLIQNFPIYEQLINYVREMDRENTDHAFYSWVRDSVAQLEIEYNAGRLLCYFTAWMIDQGNKPTSQAALCKAFCTSYEQRLNDLATRVVGPVSRIRAGSRWMPFAVDLAESYLWGPSYTLQGGSVEVLKNIVARRGLKLPQK